MRAVISDLDLLRIIETKSPRSKARVSCAASWNHWGNSLRLFVKFEVSAGAPGVPGAKVFVELRAVCQYV